MGGVAVANGSTLSTTGEMQVTCNVPYVLKVDAVEWIPVASNDGVDTYILSTNGIVRIFINGIRYFYFVNSLALDFSIRSTVLFQRPASGVGNLSTTSKNGSYVQVQFLPECGFVVVYVYSTDLTAEELLALGATVSQGEIDRSYKDGSAATFWIRSVDPTNYLTVYCGNVLAAFVTPAE